MKKLLLSIIISLFLCTGVYAGPWISGGSSGGSGSGDVTAASTAQTWGDGTGPVVWTFSVTGTDPTISVATGAFTLNTDLALDANDITMTGSLGATGTRLTKGWFTDLEVTNAIAGSVTGNAGTATALAADPADCAAGQVATGIAASGALSCTATPSVTTLTGAVTGTASGNIPNTLADAAGDMIYATADDTWAKLTAGTAGYVLKMGASVPEWSNSLSLATLDMTSATSSIPMVVGTGTVDAGMTAAGKMYFESDTEILSIGDGATIINLDMAPNVTYTFPSATSTLASLAGSETLTNKTLTTPVITALEVFIDCNGSTDPYAYCTSANASTLTATQVNRTIINTYGRGEAQTVTLPTAAAGMTFIVIVGTQHNSKFEIAKGASDLYLEVSGAPHRVAAFSETNEAVGSRASCATFKTGAAAWSWMCGGVSGTWDHTDL